MNKSLQRMRLAIWLLVGYAIFLTWVIWGVQDGLWMAIDANYEVSQIDKETKLPCSSEINENCAVYVK